MYYVQSRGYRGAQRQEMKAGRKEQGASEGRKVARRNEAPSQRVEYARGFRAGRVASSAELETETEVLGEASDKYGSAECKRR